MPHADLFTARGTTCATPHASGMPAHDILHKLSNRRATYCATGTTVAIVSRRLWGVIDCHLTIASTDLSFDVATSSQGHAELN